MNNMEYLFKTRGGSPLAGGGVSVESTNVRKRMFTMSGTREGPECVDGQNCISSSVEPRVFLRVTVTLMLRRVSVFIGVVPLRTAVSTKRIIRK